MNGDDGEQVAARFGDHRNVVLRDVAPGKTPITFFRADGSVWMVIDMDERLETALRRVAEQEGVDPDELLSLAFVEQARKMFDERERGF